MDYYWSLLVLKLLFIVQVYGLQQFVEQPQNISVIKGEIAVLRCVVENMVGQIQWAKDGFPLGYVRSIPGFSRYSVIGSNSREFNLQITDVRLDDDAKFDCQVSPAENNPPLQASAFLNVLVPPNMPQIEGYANGSKVQVRYNQPLLELVCTSINGKPAAALTWLRNGEVVTDSVVYTTEPLDNDKRENARSVITIRPQYPEDNQAVYQCHARNNAIISGPLRAVVTLDVQYPPGEPVITGYRRNEAIRTNDTIHMICTSEGGNPLAQVVWFRNNEQVDFSYTQRDNKATNELTFTAQRSDNDAEYRCEAWNVVNALSPHVIKRKLLVQFAPKSVTISGTREAKAGETLTLTCTTGNSNPAAVITWIPQTQSIVQDRTRQEPSPDGGFITISEIDVTLTPTQTSAIYTCSASNNQLGITIADTATVGVLYPPDPPQIFGYTEGDSVRAGTLLRMTCRAIGGNPPATLAWYKGDEVLPFINTTIGNLPSLEVAIVTKANDNGALYKCTATNRATESPLEAVKKLTVHFPPSSVRITSEPAVARAGHRLKLTCVTSSSNPAAAIQWIHKDLPVQGRNLSDTAAENGGMSSRNILDIIPTSEDHEAVYGCQATNRMLQEMIHDAITLNVLFKPTFLQDLSFEILEFASQVQNLSALANPYNSTYSLLCKGVIVNTGDIGSFTLDGSVLTISSITRDDGGPFTIVATNTEGITSNNFTINVLYPAEIYEANPVEGEVGSSVTLTCLARGNPMSDTMVTWTRDGWDMTRALPSYSGGVATLRIDGVEKTDSGIYNCIADNGKGTPVTHTVELTVKFAPSIDKSQEYGKAASQKGLTGRLECHAEGAPSVTFQWQKDGNILVSDPVKYVIEQKMPDKDNLFYTTNILLVKDVQKTDYGIYNCIVTNEKGEDRFNIEFKNTTVPDPPYNIQFVNATHNSITIKWTKGFNGGKEQSFRVRYTESTSTSYVQVDVQPSSATVVTVKGLGLGTEYKLSVMAYNDIGGSEYQVAELEATTSNLKPTDPDTSPAQDTEDTPVIIILVVCVVGIFLLALNIGLILFFVRRRKKRMENGSDTTSHTNTIELYGPSKETALYPMTPSDESRSYGTYDKNDDDFSDDYKSYEHLQRHKHCSVVDGCLCLRVPKSESTSSWKDNCCFDPGDDDLKRVFLPPPQYGEVTYSHNKMDSPTFDHRHPIHMTEMKYPYNGSDTDSCRKSPYQYEDTYKPQPQPRGKGTFDPDYPDNLHHREDSGSGMVYEPNGRAGERLQHRPKSVTELSERSSRPSSRGGRKTPPPPPQRSSSKGAADIPPLPARNYGSQEAIPRYGPTPGSGSNFSNNVNVIPNPSYEGPSIRTPSPRQPTDPHDDMRGHLV